MKATDSEARVTLVVVPRERFSHARYSLESILKYTDCPYQLVYVDGNSPASLRDYLQARAGERGFKLIRTDYYLSPNHARNLGLKQVDTEYVVFIDNDVEVTRGWLSKLIECADATDAAVVSPLICQGTPVHETIHCAGGISGVELRQQGDKLSRHLIEKIFRQGQKLAEVRDQLSRQPTGLAEFHCMLVRTSMLERIGPLDEKLLSSKEHVDLCIAVAEAGGSIYLEPDSLVTYVTASLLAPSDIHYYMLRWSDAWWLSSFQHLQQKWQVTDQDVYFQGRLRFMGGRRRANIIRPLLKRIPFGRRSPRAEKLLLRAERLLNRYLTERYARQRVRYLGKSASRESTA